MILPDILKVAKPKLHRSILKVSSLRMIAPLVFLPILFACAKTEVTANSRDSAPKAGTPTLSPGKDDEPGTLTDPKMNINAKAEYSTAIEVELTISVIGAVEMYITNEAGCAEGGTWELYGSTKTWKLAQSNAEATVYAKFRGIKKTESPCISDVILHDDVGPSIIGEFSDGESTNSLVKSPTATWQPANDGFGSGLDFYELAIGTKAGTDDAYPWTSVRGVTSFEAKGLASDLGATYYTSVRAVDRAGNRGPVVQGDGWLVTKWRQNAYIKASNSNTSKLFGSAVAIYRDRAAVGTPKDYAGQNYISDGQSLSEVNEVSTSGAVFIYRQNDAGWVTEAFVKASNVGIGDLFGTSVDMTHDTLVVGAPFEDSNQTSISNGTLANQDDSLPDSGAVYVYRRTGVTWEQESFIKASNAGAGDKFGTSVAIFGDFLVVGAPEEDSSGEPSDDSLQNAGAVYVFYRIGPSWEQVAYLKASNPDVDDRFGNAIDLNETQIVVAAPNEDGGSFAISNITEMASDDNTMEDAGAAYVFEPQGSDWVQTAYLKAANGDKGDLFGSSIAISAEGIVVVGAIHEDSPAGIIESSELIDVNSVTNSGAVYVFQEAENKWQTMALLKASNANPFGKFGFSVAIHGDRVCVGSTGEGSLTNAVISKLNTAPNGDSNPGVGAAFVFNMDDGWNQEAYLKASNSDPGDNFGFAVGIFDGVSIVGTKAEGSNQKTITNGTEASEDNSKQGSGAAYVFKLE